MKKSFITLVAFITLLSSGLPTAHAQSTTTAFTCTPVQQLTKTKTYIECRLKAPETSAFTMMEVTFPFHVTRVIKSSSHYSATISSLYPAEVVENTLVVASVDWGASTTPGSPQVIPFDGLSLYVETDQTMSEIKTAFQTKKTGISFLVGATPVETAIADNTLAFDGSLILESFTQYLSPGVLQFLRLGIACYEKTPEACLTNIIQNL